MKNFKKYLTLILLLCILVGCNPAKKDWEKVKMTANYSELLQFINKYPDFENITEAERLAWELIVKSDSAKGYEEYLTSITTPKYIVDAKKALEEIVVFPTLGFVGNEDEIPADEKLKVQEKYLRAEAMDVLSYKDFSIKGNFPYIYIGHKWIKLSDDNYSGHSINTEKYGKLYCRLATSVGFNMLFYMGGTRAQRDAVYGK